MSCTSLKRSAESNTQDSSKISKSIIWEAFKLNKERKEAKCSSCSKVFKYSGSTSTLFYHLRNCAGAKTSIEKKKEQLLPASNSSNLQQMSMTSFLSPSLKVDTFNRTLAKAFVSAGWPIRSIENEDVKKLFHMISPNLKLPGRTSLTSLIDEEYDTILTKVSLCIHSIEVQGMFGC